MNQFILFFKICNKVELVCEFIIEPSLKTLLTAWLQIEQCM